MTNLLDVENLQVSFSIHGKILRAVRGVSFQMAAGESVGIVGESGCGKTACVQSFLRLNHAAISGRVTYNGVDLLQVPDLKPYRGREIGMIFQDPFASLNPTMRIGDQIAEGLIYHRILSKQEAKAKALELLHLVGISEPELRMREYPHALSGGMRQRVLIAIAISMSPRLIIADEPTTALDVTVSAQILSLLKTLREKLGTALLLITHDLSVVASTCDRVLVMYAGKIVEEGPVENVFAEPKHPYTRLLLKSIPRLDRPKSEKLIPIEGAPPNLWTQQLGCSFAPRCPHATQKCRENEPHLTLHAHRSACFWEGKN